MQLSNYIQTKISFFVALSFSLFLASCGSYQYIGYDTDGIYNNSSEKVIYEQPKTVPTQTQTVYKDYFTQKTLQYSEIPNDSTAIFTDIDSYKGNYTTEVVDGVEYGQPGWGQSDSNVTINVYDNSWNQPWGWNAGFGWNNWGYNQIGWYRPWGYNNWGWNAGFGNGYAWNPWGWNNNFWCPPYYRNNYYGGNNYAYNYGRRGNSQNRYTTPGRSNLSRSASASVRRTVGVQSRNTSSFNPRRTSTNVRARNTNTTTRPRNNNTSARSRSNSSRSSNTSVRPRSNSSRNSNSSARSNSSRNRSSSSARSSRGSSSRSSGASRSGGRSSRGSSGRRG